MNWMPASVSRAVIYEILERFTSETQEVLLFYCMYLITDRITDKLMFTQEPVSPLLAHSLLYFFPSLLDLDKFVAAASSPGPGQGWRRRRMLCWWCGQDGNYVTQRFINYFSLLGPAHSAAAQQPFSDDSSFSLPP